MPEVATPPVDEDQQVALLDLSGKDIDAYWVDEKQPLFVPSNPLHWKTHKLQLLLKRLDQQFKVKSNSVDSQTYLRILNEYERCCEQINNITKGLSPDENLESGELDSKRTSDKSSAAMGSGIASGLDFGVSADNPLTGQGSDTP